MQAGLVSLCPLVLTPLGSLYQVYYKNADEVIEDEELMTWWEDIKYKGHGDLIFQNKIPEQEIWPELKTVEDLVEIMTTIIWVVSAHHAALNFSQFDYNGYFLNRPSLCRIPLPLEEDLIPNQGGKPGESKYSGAQLESSPFPLQGASNATHALFLILQRSSF